MATGKALDGKPYAGNPHVRFDEGEVAPATTPRRGSLLYTKTPAEVKEYLATIRKTVADSQAAIDAAQLRLKETDRLLESQGLTREQVLNFKVTPAHRLAVNEELRRRGLPPLEDDTAAGDFDAATAQLRSEAAAPHVEPEADPADRPRRFANLMHEFRI